MRSEIATEDNGLMSFEEIGRRLGVSRERAHAIYKRAIEKIRRNPRAIKKLESVVHLKRTGF